MSRSTFEQEQTMQLYFRQSQSSTATVDLIVCDTKCEVTFPKHPWQLST